MKIAHLFVHKAPNAGDGCVRESVRQLLFERYPSAIIEDFELIDVRWTEQHIERLNCCDFAVVGGGGLFHPYTNGISDWLWACSPELVDKIEVPLVVLAVGFDRFRRQRDFDRNLFDAQIQAVIDKSVLFSVRNTGSRMALRQYVRLEQWRDSIEVAYCPTILLASQFERSSKPTGKIGLMLGGDFLSNRYANIQLFLSKIIALVRKLREHWDVVPIFHQKSDAWYLGHMTGFNLQSRTLVGVPAADTLHFYQQMDFVIGTRGHSLMVPFGIGCRIAGIVTHEKARWFLDDIGLPGNGIEEDDPQLVEKLVSLVEADPREYYKTRATALRTIEIEEKKLIDKMVSEIEIRAPD